MSEHYIATEYAISQGVGVSLKRLPSFDKALLDAGVGNYNLVRLSSILPAGCVEVDVDDIASHIKEGSLLPTAYSTISSSKMGEHIVSTIVIGFPVDAEKVCVIMEYSVADVDAETALRTLKDMIKEAFEERGWELDHIKATSAEADVDVEGATFTTFACVSEW